MSRRKRTSRRTVQSTRVERSYSEIAKALAITTDDVRAAEDRAIRKLRRGARAAALRPYADEPPRGGSR